MADAPSLRHDIAMQSYRMKEDVERVAVSPACHLNHRIIELHSFAEIKLRGGSVDFFFLRRTNTSDDVAYSETSVEHHNFRQQKARRLATSYRPSYELSN